VDYALNRRQFGKPIAVSAGPGQAVADAGRHRGMQLRCRRLVHLQDQGKATLALRLLAKLNTAGAARRVCADADDILDGNGTLLDFHVAQHHADIEAVCPTRAPVPSSRSSSAERSRSTRVRTVPPGRYRGRPRHRGAGAAALARLPWALDPLQGMTLRSGQPWKRVVEDSFQEVSQRSKRD
jgi:hypothetical protein